TFDVVRNATRGWDVPVRALRYRPNVGKGYAIKFGVARARGDRILFTDADLSTPIEQTGAFLARLDAGADVVIGSRKTPWAEIVVHQPWYREQLGKAYTRLVRRVIADVSDVTCGFKAFRAAAAKDIFARVRLYDWSFDAEVLLLVRQLAYRLDEVAVRWEDRAGSRVRLVRDVARSLWGIVRQAGIRPHDRVLELGAGFGRFTFPLLAHCGSVLAVDLSRRVLAALAAERDTRGVPADRCPTLCADVDALTPDVVGAPPDFVVGVFFLHHLADFRRTLARLAGLVAPGGGLAFVEPNRRNPLFLFQIACCPGMRWGEERGLYRLGEHDLRAAIAASGLADARTRTF